MTIIHTLQNASRPPCLIAGSIMGGAMLLAGPAAASPLSILPHAALASFAATAAPLMIPEPASAALLVVGLTISAVAARRRRRRARKQEAVLP